jgi:hypothetical protein
MGCLSCQPASRQEIGIVRVYTQREAVSGLSTASGGTDPAFSRVAREAMLDVSRRAYRSPLRATDGGRACAERPSVGTGAVDGARGSWDCTGIDIAS